MRKKKRGKSRWRAADDVHRLWGTLQGPKKRRILWREKKPALIFKACGNGSEGSAQNSILHARTRREEEKGVVCAFGMELMGESDGWDYRRIIPPLRLAEKRGGKRTLKLSV